MHIVFVPPATGLLNAWKGERIPTGVLLLAAILRERGWTCEVWDGVLLFPHGAHEAACDLLARRPDVVGVSTWCHTYPAQLALVRALHDLAPDLPVVLGGPQATVTDRATLEAWPFVRLVLRGEAELSLPVLVDALAAGSALDRVPGLTWRDGGVVTRNPDAPTPIDLDALPRPAHDLAPPGVDATVETGRGCPFVCRFCSTTAFFQRRHRLRDPARVVDELTDLVQRGVREVTFTNDTFTVDRRHVRALCGAIRDRALSLRWGCTTHVNTVDRGLLDDMAAAGCTSILYGVESGSPRMQAAMAKRLDLARVARLVEQTAAAGIRPFCTFIMGFPDEGPEDLAQTVALMQRLAAAGVQVHVQTLAALPDTPYFADHVDELCYDGFFSFSRAVLTAEDEATVRRHPAIFSAFHYLPSPAAPREHLVGYAQLGNLLRHFHHTARLAGWGSERQPFARLAEAIDSGLLTGDLLRGGFDEAVLPVLAGCAGAAAPVHALEEAVFMRRLDLLHRRPLRQGALHWAPEWLAFVSPVRLEPLLTGQGSPSPQQAVYLVRLHGDDGFLLHRVTAAVAPTLLELLAGGPLAAEAHSLLASLHEQGITAPAPQTTEVPC